MDSTTLAIATFGALIAMLSLGWQIAAWMLEGRRVRVALRYGLLTQGASATGLVGRDHQPRDLRALRAQGMDGPEVVGITVTNLGRSTVTISQYSVLLVKGGVSLNLFNGGVSSPLPFRLPAGESETRYAPMDDVHALLAAQNTISGHYIRRICMAVELGTGNVKKTRRSLRVPI